MQTKKNHQKLTALIKYGMEMQGLKQEELAVFMHMCSSTMSKRMNQEADRWTVKELNMLAEKLKLKKEDVMEAIFDV